MSIWPVPLTASMPSDGNKTNRGQAIGKYINEMSPIFKSAPLPALVLRWAANSVWKHTTKDAGFYARKYVEVTKHQHN